MLSSCIIYLNIAPGLNLRFAFKSLSYLRTLQSMKRLGLLTYLRAHL